MTDDEEAQLILALQEASSFRLCFLHCLGMLHDETSAHQRTKARLKAADAQIATLMGLTPSPDFATGTLAPDATDGPDRRQDFLGP